jgi:putative transposase
MSFEFIKYGSWDTNHGDLLAVHLFTSKVAYQKMEYIHRNPIAERWQLVKDPCDYLYSSATYYEKSEKRYSFSKDLRDEF